MSTESIVDSIIAGELNDAGEQFEAEMQSRISDALDAKRVEIGSGISFDDAIEEDEIDLEELMDDSGWEDESEESEEPLEEPEE